MPGGRPVHALMLLAAVWLCALGGCAHSGANLTLRSVARGETYKPRLVTSVYRYEDLNTADVYLSDIPMAVLANPDVDLREWGAEAGGTIIHIHIFVLPKAGKTPIDRTACNATLRQLVLAPPTPPAAAADDDARGAQPAAGSAEAGRAALGLYGGGGFVLPGRDFFGGGGKPGGATLSGTIRRGRGALEGAVPGSDGAGHGSGGGSLRLIRAEPAFADPIGAAELSGSFTAVLDEPLADVMGARLERLISSIPAVPQPKPEEVVEDPAVIEVE